MKILLLGLFALLIPLTAGCRQPSGMYQPAVVKIIDSQPCFGVADSDETRHTPPTIAAISVDRGTDGGVENVWSWITPLTPAVTLHPSDCIPYGYGASAGEAHQSGHNPSVGERYSVSINAQIPNPSPHGDRMLGRMYGLEFCLVKSADGELRAISVPRSRGAPMWQVCEVSESER